MKFNRDLDPDVQCRVKDSDEKLADPSRLAALERSGLLDAPADEAFDRLARVAAHVLDVPLTIVSLVATDRQFFIAGYGLPEPYDKLRGVPIEASICRYTLNNQEIVAHDSSRDGLLASHPTTESWGVGSFIAIPMMTHDHQVLGAFCAVDRVPRLWSERDIEFMREMTLSVMTEIRLREQIAELDSEKKMREQFVATLTHDLLNPIGVIKGSAELLGDSAEPGTQNAQLIRMIANNSARAEAMIRDLLNVSSVRAGQEMQIAPSETSFNEILDQVRGSLMGSQKDYFKVTGDTNVHGYWDAIALRRVIDNLISNAFKYGQPQTPVTLDATSKGSEFSFSVHNLGQPIEANSLKSIFESFNRTATARAGTVKGWGIGLALVKALTAAHGGTVSVRSGVDGTRFEVTLPLRATPVSSL